ncbi:hypothetical protein [Kitasatospora sp. A2-31]|nr:hypothetical protein [Kitasatospora sp. A2-31]
MTEMGLDTGGKAGSVREAVKEREEVRPMKAVCGWVLPLVVTAGD